MALLLAVLGLGMLCAPAVAARSVPTVADSVSAAASVPVSAAEPAAESVSVSAPGHDRPGCGQGERRDGLDDPAQSPRPSTSLELLPALAEAHGGGGSWAGDPAFLVLTPVRGPPEPIAPSPFALSVLRV